MELIPHVDCTCFPKNSVDGAGCILSKNPIDDATFINLRGACSMLEMLIWYT